MKPEFIGSANRLVYHFAIPAMIFRAIARSTFEAQFDYMVMVITLLSVMVVFVFSLAWVHFSKLSWSQRGTFVQASIHGNLGYIGLAIAYYYLGNEGFVKAGLIAGFLIILQNFLAVSVLQLYAEKGLSQSGSWIALKKIIGNPIILAALLGIGFSRTGTPLPIVVDRSLEILSDLALPMALLIIGASLSFHLMQVNLSKVLVTTVMKLVLLPLVGLIFYYATGKVAADFLPGLILLASPTATVVYVMAREMNGDTDFATAGISTSTLLSAVTFTLWINVVD